MLESYLGWKETMSQKTKNKLEKGLGSYCHANVFQASLDYRRPHLKEKFLKF